MKRAESKEKYEAFVEVSKQLQRFLENRESPDEDYNIVGQTYNSLLAELLANIECFSGEQRQFIEDAKRKTSLPQHRLARCRARARSRSRSPSVSQPSLSSEESFASTSNNSTMDEEARKKADAEAAAQKAAEEEAARQKSLTEALTGGENAPSSRMAQLQLELSEEADLAEMEELKLRHAAKNRKRKIIQKAIDEGINEAQLSEHLASLNVSGSQKPSDPPPTAAVIDGAAAAAAAISPNVDLSHLLGSQRLKYSTPKEADRFSGGEVQYSRFIEKFKSEVMDVPGVTDAERFVALQDRTSGEAYKMVSNYIYLTDKSAALKDALEELKFFYGKRQGKAESYLAKILEGKEVPTNSVDGIKGLIQEIQEMCAFAKATKEASFLELKATVVSIVKKRLSYKVKEKFSKVSGTAEDKGEKVNINFLIKFQV